MNRPRTTGDVPTATSLLTTRCANEEPEPSIIPSSFAIGREGIRLYEYRKYVIIYSNMKFDFKNVEYKKLIGPAIVAALFILIYYPTFEWMGNTWLHSDNYSHGFLLLPVAALIIWTRRYDLHEKSSQNQAGVLLLAAGLGMHIAGYVLIDNLLSGLSLFLTLPGLILVFRGIKALRALAFPIFMLVFMIPFPWVMEKVGVWLQSFAARASAWFVDLVGVEVTRTGSEIKLADAAFKVDMACSGMHSLIALLALSAIFAYVLKGTFTKKAILFLLAIPVAILANLIRLISILLIGDRWGEDVATGFYHDAASPFLFLVAIIFMVIIAKLLGFNLREAPELP